jgi:hypothetical protein
MRELNLKVNPSNITPFGILIIVHLLVDFVRCHIIFKVTFMTIVENHKLVIIIIQAQMEIFPCILIDLSSQWGTIYDIQIKLTSDK